MKAVDRTFDSIKVGENVERTYTINTRAIENFAELSGDYNPLHTNPSYAAHTTFVRPVVHGMLLGAYVSELLGMHLPGARCLILKESLEFKKPLYAGDEILIRAEVVQKSEGARLLVIKISVMHRDELVADGTVHTSIVDPHA